MSLFIELSEHEKNIVIHTEEVLGQIIIDPNMSAQELGRLLYPNLNDTWHITTKNHDGSLRNGRITKVNVQQKIYDGTPLVATRESAARHLLAINAREVVFSRQRDLSLPVIPQPKTT